MLTRRHIRVKVMQAVYAFSKASEDNLSKQEKFINASSESMYDLYILMLSLLSEIRKLAADRLKKSQKKYLATEEDKDPNKKFVNNQLLQQLSINRQLETELEYRKLNNWKMDDEYVAIIWNELRESESYKSYMSTKETSYKEDKNFIISIYRDIIAPNDKLYEYFEDNKLTWLDDLPVVNTVVVKTLKQFGPKADESFYLPDLYKDEEDKEFAKELFRKTVLNDEKLLKEIEGKTPNWDKERIADIDMVLLKMAICEFLNFPSIPIKVTINEYLEIAKEYSTPKSSVFINGILDKLTKEYIENNKLNKSGRGLM
ncbi:transcription antitermination factor NusB [Sungkyunkwania multivorans]|uniref:Transcription antitermination factor NusB n=1 Tax=Sungkyunkwania multivorans TaxID=1173618 RepID=A0ABW3D262_9FLAO